MGSLVSGTSRTPSGGGPGRVMNARSSRPSATSWASTAEPAWRSRTSTSPCSARNRASSAPTSTVTHCSVPTDRLPRSRPWTAATASRAARMPARVRVASVSSARPAPVSSTLRVVRVKSAAPSSRSRARTEADSPDWETIIRWAALVKCRSSATATKYSSCLNSMIEKCSR